MAAEFLRSRFLKEVKDLGGVVPKAVVVAVKLPSGAIEIITNTQHLIDKLDYYAAAYDKRFRLITNPEVQIVGYMIV